VVQYPDFPLWVAAAGLVLAWIILPRWRRWRESRRLMFAIELIMALASHSAPIQLLAIAGLRRIGGVEASPLIVRALKEFIDRSFHNGGSDSADVCWAALEALGRVRRRREREPLVFSNIDFEFGHRSYWPETGIPSGSELAGVVFVECRLPRQIATCSFHGATFRRMTLVDSSFTYSDLRGAVFEDCSLRKVNFDTCLMKHAAFKGGSLEEVVFSADVSKQITIAGSVPNDVQMRSPAGWLGRMRNRWFKGPHWGPRWPFADKYWFVLPGIALAGFAVLVAPFVTGSGPNDVRDILRAVANGEVLALFRSDELFDDGNAAYKAGQYDEAATDYAEVSRLRPRDRSAHYNLGLAHLESGQYAEAIEDFDASERLGSPTADVAYLRAEAKCALGAFDAAQPDVRVALAEAPTGALADRLRIACRVTDSAPESGRPP
jgi:Pentapeptide repeats (9 copies)/Tetratricopeptide repeat